MLGEYLSSEHLIASPSFANGTTAFIKLDRAIFLVLVPVLILMVIILFIH